jgi:hypothetical protein
VKTLPESKEVLQLAVAIADDAARADIELNARRVTTADGEIGYDIDTAELHAEQTEKDRAAAVRTAQRAALYIILRGADYPALMREIPGTRGRFIVFAEREG